MLDAKLEALADALIAKALGGDVGALREALQQLVGRPTEVVQGNPTARSASSLGRSPRGARGPQADVKAEDAEVEELGYEEWLTSLATI